LRIIVTGGAGFIGSAVIRYLINETEHYVLNIDALTYAGNLESLTSVSDSIHYSFARADICNASKLKKIIFDYEPDCIMHLAAESHVDRSIDGPSKFIETNIFGTYNLLEISREYWKSNKNFFFHHVSTDEVYGDLENKNETQFTENSPYRPSSPYSASKASSDHLVRAWNKTYDLPIIITNCSNNYGPFQFPEKLIPHTILNAISGSRIPIYGSGLQIRDWLYVEDHAKALVEIAQRREGSGTYNIGGNNEVSNIDVVNTICEILEILVPKKPKNIAKYKDLISYVEDRPGHDFRYAIDSSKIELEINWKPEESFESGLKKTVNWYLDNPSWWKKILNGTYRLNRIGELN